MSSRLPIIGITGGIGSGKSLVANILRENGCVVADADENTKIVLAREEVQQQLVAWWGDEVLDENELVDRAFIASIVFKDAKEREKLESLIHSLDKIPLATHGRANVIHRHLHYGDIPENLVL